MRSEKDFENHTFSLGINNRTTKVSKLLEIPSFKLSDAF